MAASQRGRAGDGKGRDAPKTTPAPLIIRLYQFTAPWCSACKALTPVLKSWIASHPEVELVVVDVDSAGDHSALVERFLVKSLPTLVFTDPKDERLPLDVLMGTSYKPQVDLDVHLAKAKTKLGK